MAKIPKTTDVVVIGGGLSGLIIAAGLEKAGLDFLLVESQDEFGGLTKGQQEHGIWLDYGLKSLPVGNVSENPLVRLKKELDLECAIESWTEPVVTLGKTEFNEFVGFGETTNRTLVEELGYFTQTPRLLVSGGWKSLIDELLRRIPEEKRITKAQVTKIETEEDNVISLKINGDQAIGAKNFVFSVSPKHLPDVLSPQTFKSKAFQKIAKTEPLTALSLDIATRKKITDRKNVFLFKDTAAEDFFVVGYFINNIDPLRPSAGLHVSTWMTFLNSESALDDEHSSKALRTMKKLLRRAFPELIEDAAWERILVAPHAVGRFNHLKLEKNFTLPGLNNLWMTGAQTGASTMNLETAIASALEVTHHLTETPK